MAAGASKFLFFYLLSALAVSSSGIYARTDFKKRELEREKEQIFHESRREVLGSFHYRAIQHDLNDPPTTVYPTTPVTNPVTTPVTLPPDNSAPLVVTVPATNPDSGTPNPASTAPFPNTNPVNSPLPITNPVTTPSTNPGGQAPVNPVTTYPAPAQVVPFSAPVTTPTTTNAPAVSGQSWCIAKSGTSETALQAALDYACGIGHADCSVIQQGASCYNPNSLQNHASYAFNSYYQKNPNPTSCDFGGAAMITNANPSSGSCIYPTSSSSSASPATPSTSTPNSSVPTATSPNLPSPMPTTSSSSGATVPGSGVPPSVLNTTNPALGGAPTGFSDSPPTLNSPTSMSNGLNPFVSCIFLVTSFITSKFLMDM